MASLTDGLGQSIISRLAQPPDVTTGESGIPALFGGLSSGFQAGRQFVKDRRGFKAAKDEMSAMVGGKGISTRDAKAAGLVKPSFLEAFAGGMTRTPGVRAAGRDPNFSINQKIAEQNLRMNELQINELMEQRENRLAAREASLDLSRYIAEGMRSGLVNSPEFRAGVGERISRFPDSLTPNVLQQLKFLEQSQIVERENEKLRRKPDIAPGLVPSRQTVETPTGTITLEPPPPAPAAPIPGLIPSRQTIIGPTGSVTLEPPPLAPGPVSTPGKIIADRRAMVAAGATAEELAMFDAQAAKNGMVLEVGPDGTTRFIQGPGATAGTASQVQRAESLVNIQTQIQRGFQLQELISAQDLGVQGVVGEFLDEVVAQAFPGVADSSRVRNRERLRLFFLGALPILMAEGGTGRLSDKDIALMRDALTSEKALGESLQSLGPKMEIIRQELVLKGRASVIASGQEIPLMLMLPEEVARLRKEGRLDNDSFARYLRQTPFVDEARRAFSSP